MPEPQIPDGYIVATVSQYPEAMTDRKSGREYRLSVQILNCDTGDCPRGVGMDFASALEHAISNVGGDDGLSAAFRKAFQGPTQ